MNIQTLTLGPLATNCYLVRQDGCSRAVIIDPAANSRKLLAALQEQALTLEAIFLTHAHFDHIGALKNLHAATQAPIWIGEADKDDPSHMCRRVLLECKAGVYQLRCRFCMQVQKQKMNQVTR